MDGSPLPEGFRLFVYPAYKLVTPTCSIPLTMRHGEILSILVGNKGRHISCREIADLVYLDYEDGGPVCYENVIRVCLHKMRRELKSCGVLLDIDSKCGRSGYIFRGLSACKPDGKFIRRRAPDGFLTMPDGRLKPIPKGWTWDDVKASLPPPPKTQDKKPAYDLKRDKRKKHGPPPPPPSPSPRKIRKNIDQSRPPDVLPPEYARAQRAPWIFPPGHKDYSEGKSRG